MVVRRVVLACALAAVLVAPAPGPALTGIAGGPSAPQTRVLVISVDGLNPAALRQLGPTGTPSFHRLMSEGAFTLNARTQVEMTTTLPNHTSMVTGRRIVRKHEGHGVTWNTDIRGRTVQKAAGHSVGSIFSWVRKAGLSVALFAAKAKFSLFKRSWPGINRVTIKAGRDAALVNAARSDLVDHHRAFTFLHLGDPDLTGHAHGFMTPAYLDAVRRTDSRIGAILETIDAHEELDDLVVLLTSDHGGRGTDHSDPTRLANYRIPFLVWGPGVVHDNLYDLNPTYQDPSAERVGFKGRQPIRNGDVANLAAYLLGLGPVPNSRWDFDQSLRVN